MIINLAGSDSNFYQTGLKKEACSWVKVGMPMLAILLAILALVSGCSGPRIPEPERPEAQSNISVDHITATVRKTNARNIESSPFFSLKWISSQGSPVNPTDYGANMEICRLPSRWFFLGFESFESNNLKIIDSTTGQKILEVKLPKEILNNYPRADGEIGTWNDFEYNAFRSMGKIFILVKAVQSKYSDDGRSGEGIGTVLYCCSTEGKIVWTYLGELTHSILVLPVNDDNDLILIPQGYKHLVGLGISGKEIFRVKTPPFNFLEVSDRNKDGIIEAYFLSDQLYCYTLVRDALLKQLEPNDLIQVPDKR